MVLRISYFILSLIVIVSLLGPSILPLFEGSDDAVVMADFLEEETQKETEKDNNDKEVYYHDYLNFQQVKTTSDSFKFHEQDFFITKAIFDIIIPPPKYNS